MHCKQGFGGVILLAGLLTVAGVHSAPVSPTEAVKRSTDEVLTVVAEKGLDKDVRKKKIRSKIRQLVNSKFDFRSMSQSVLSTHWKKATAYERDRFVEFFTLSLENTYTDVLDAYGNEKISYIGEKIKGNRATVNTLIVSADKNIPVTYKLKLDDGNWFAYDVVVENASLVSTYRDLYANIVKSQGVSGLLEQMKNSLGSPQQ